MVCPCSGVDTPTARKVDNLTYSEWLAATTDVTFHDDVLKRFFDRFDVGTYTYIHVP